MQELPKQYAPSSIENKWYAFWEENKFFHSEPDKREPYTIVIPPPNVTGVLHMGHILNNTIQDILIRRARQLGKNACWVPGTDHASIATEAKVVQKLRKEGIKKADLSRDEFLKHAWEWTEKHGGIILQQLKTLGASCDWDRTRFTLEPELYDAVIEAFIDLYAKGYIYRGKRMINWDPEAKTALSDEEVIFKEVKSKLTHIRYQIEGEENYIVIATQRPETIMADAAVAINPNDERFNHLKGKRVIIPLINKAIPIIEDDYVDIEFGTGCLKVTPAHDKNDNEIGIRHNLEVIDILNPDGTLNADAQILVGLDRFKAREEIIKLLEEAGALDGEEEYTTNMGYSERTDAVIEPRLSLQWFMKMEEISKPALDAVVNGEVNFHPNKFVNTYKHWMENIRDWCISRQLWWGQRIPAWYINGSEEEYVIAKTEDEALEKARKKTGNAQLQVSDIKQDEDVLDTWFSSWLWPMSVFNEKDRDYYYPTNDLVTAPEIMFFWVARMIIAGFAFEHQKPFSNVYYTGIVRDKKRRKMSKSLGNSPDPLDLIAKHGADAVRMGMLFSSPAGNDLLFDESQIEQGRNFANKIWNAFRFLSMNRQDGFTYSSDLNIDANNLVDRWMLGRVNDTIEAMNDDFDKFRINDALKKIYSLVWDDFCDWYIELIKSETYGEPIPQERLATAFAIFEQLMKLLHPFMPFITEELWHAMKERDVKDAIIISSWPKPIQTDIANAESVKAFEAIQKAISSLRNIRAEMNIPPKVNFNLVIKTKNESATSLLTQNEWVFRKLDSIGTYETGTAVQKPKASASAVVDGNEFYIPLEGIVDFDVEKTRISKEINRLDGFLKSVEAKLSNEKFVANAPEDVLANERKKQADASTTIVKLKEILADLV
ncbi:valine--tRNA ligase [bacterium]|nr:MAG: valine--tRNA ligase [bacterium]